jgi:hypothetical protein
VTVVSYGPDSANKYATTYFIRRFDVADASVVTGLSLGLLRDDGAIVYLNRTEVVRDNMTSGAVDFQTFALEAVGGADETTFFSYVLDPALLADGQNVLAVEIHQSSGGSTDLSFDLELTAQVAGESSPPIPIDHTVTVRARVYSGGAWGALSKARYTVGLKGLVINEVVASNKSGLEDLAEPGEHPDWIEIYNGAAGTIDLGGLYLTDDPLRLTKWTFATGITIDPGEHLVFLADDDGTQGPAHTNFQISANGETIILVDRDGETVIDELVFDRQYTDVSFGRYPDGGSTWVFPKWATPGEANVSAP